MDSCPREDLIGPARQWSGRLFRAVAFLTATVPAMGSPASRSPSKRMSSCPPLLHVEAGIVGPVESGTVDGIGQRQRTGSDAGPRVDAGGLDGVGFDRLQGSAQVIGPRVALPWITALQAGLVDSHVDEVHGLLLIEPHIVERFRFRRFAAVEAHEAWMRTPARIHVDPRGEDGAVVDVYQDLHTGGVRGSHRVSGVVHADGDVRVVGVSAFEHVVFSQVGVS